MTYENYKIVLIKLRKVKDLLTFIDSRYDNCKKDIIDLKLLINDIINIGYDVPLVCSALDKYLEEREKLLFGVFYTESDKYFLRCRDKVNMHIKDVQHNIKLLSNKEQFKPGGHINDRIKNPAVAHFYGESILPSIKAIKTTMDTCKEFNKVLKEVNKIPFDIKTDKGIFRNDIPVEFKGADAVRYVGMRNQHNEYVFNIKDLYKTNTCEIDFSKDVPTCKVYKDWHHETIEYIKPLSQRIKELKEKHNKEQKEYEKNIERIKVCKLLAYSIASFFGAKTKYDLTGIIRIPKIY